MKTFCPASMCPLFAPTGSPWTGEYNGECPQTDHEDGGCGFWGMFRKDEGCGGVTAARQQIHEADIELPVLQIGVVRPKNLRTEPKSYDCKRANDCQWQIESGIKLCPPRHALSLGLDPRYAAY